MNKLREFFSLLGLNLLSTGRLILEFLKVIYRYYPNRQFMRNDLVLLSRYIIKSPYKIHRNFLVSQSAEDIYTYGETPLTTLEKISEAAELTNEDIVFDLGCGPGRTSLWLRSFIGCRVIGIEQIPIFVTRAQAIVDRFDLEGIEFHQGDMRDFDYTEATAIYLYGSCFDAEFLSPLIAKFRRLKPGTKIMTVSYALNEFTPEPIFEVIKQFPARFTWGDGTVFLQKLR